MTPQENIAAAEKNMYDTWARDKAQTYALIAIAQLLAQAQEKPACQCGTDKKRNVPPMPEDRVRTPVS